MPAAGTETKVICTFASDTTVQCWVVSGTTVKDYVTGDPSSAAGITSASGKLKVHAGRHSDPFFFNLQGFRDAIATVKGAIAGGAVISGVFSANVAGNWSSAAGFAPTGGRVRFDGAAQTVSDAGREGLQGWACRRKRYARGNGRQDRT